MYDPFVIISVKNKLWAYEKKFYRFDTMRFKW